MKEVRNETPETGEPAVPTESSPYPSRDTILPGHVWWCDGISLAFDPYYKRRPVLIVGIEEDTLHVIPLSSKRRYGQETAVTHNRGVSYMTGAIHQVPTAALQKSLGSWVGFSAWYESQQGNAELEISLWQQFTECLQRIQKRIQTWISHIDTMV